LFPYTTLFRFALERAGELHVVQAGEPGEHGREGAVGACLVVEGAEIVVEAEDEGDMREGRTHGEGRAAVERAREGGLPARRLVDLGDEGLGAGVEGLEEDRG